MNKLLALLLAGITCAGTAQAEPLSILFVGNSYTFGRSNIASQSWDKVVPQKQSDEALPKQPGLASNPGFAGVAA